MFLVGMLSWWYSGGWKRRLHISSRHIKNTASFFSIGQLFSTLFAPFRQISASRVDGPVGVQLRAFFDKLMSRIIGAIVRLMTIVAGLFALTLTLIYQGLVLLAWLFLPLSPVIGLMLMVIGWVPSWQ